jgi:hypothetical protein
MRLNLEKRGVVTMHTSTILKEALNKLTKKFPEQFDLSIVLFSISVERLMKQHLYEIDAVLVLDKNNNTKHLVKFRKLQNKIQSEDFKKQLDLSAERRESFKTITFDELIKRYDAFFDLGEDRKNALKRLANLRNNIVHYFQYYIDEVEEGLFILNEIIPFLREIINEISDANKYNDIFDEKIIKKLKELENRLTKMQEDELRQKITERRRHYNEMHPDEIDVKKQTNIRDLYEEREILKEGLQCPACGNSTLTILKIFSEEADGEEEFIIKGVCSVCDLELTEKEMKNLHLI